MLNAGKGFPDIANSLGNLSEKQKVVAITSTALSNAQKGELLTQAGVSAATTNAALGYTELAASEATATASTATLSSTLKGLWLTMKPILTNPLTLAVAVGVAAVALEDLFTVDYSEANEAFEASASAYQETQSKLESLKSEAESYKKTLSSIAGNYNMEFSGTETISEMITTLNNADLTLIDQAEVDKISTANSDLERQIKLQETLTAVTSKEAINDAKEAMSKESHSVAQSIKAGDSKGEKDFKGLVGKVTDSEAIKEDVALLDEYRTELPKLEKNVAKLKEETADLSLGDAGYLTKNSELISAQQKLEFYQEAVRSLGSDISSRSKTMQGQLDILKLDPTGNADKIKELETALDSVTDMDLSESEKRLKALNSYFDGSIASNSIKDELLEIAKQGEITKKDLAEMGISLSDMGLKGKEGLSALNKYFDELVQNTKNAKEAINSVDGSVEGVTKAFQTDNQDKNWTTMADYLKQAGKLFEDGKVGTDDFKTAVQFMAPKTIDPDVMVGEGDKRHRKYKYDADAYVEAWKEAKEKVARYFDSENPWQSSVNFANDLVGKGLADKSGNEYTWTDKFKTSADAARELGLSVEAAETLMHSLEASGFEFEGIMWSSDGMKRYNESLEGIKKLYDSMDNGSEKKRLGNFIDNWEEQKATYEADMAQLTEDQVVKIEFEYDMARIQAEIDELDYNWENGGYDNKTGAARITKRMQKREELEKETGYNEETGDRGYKESYATIEELQSDLFAAKDDETKRELQNKIAAIVELQTAFQQFRLDNPEVDWNEYLASDESSEVFNEILDNFSLAKEELLNLSDIENGITGRFMNDDNTSTIVMDIEARPDQVENQLAELQAGQRLVFSASIDGNLERVEAIKNLDGTISYRIAGQEEPIPEDTYLYYWYNGQDGAHKDYAPMYYCCIGQDEPNHRNATIYYRMQIAVDPTYLAAHGLNPKDKDDIDKIFGKKKNLLEYTDTTSANNKNSKGGKIDNTPRTPTRSKAPSGGSGGAGKQRAKETKETFDWIEIAIKRAERAVSRLDAKASHTFRSFTNRNKNLKKEISQISKEITLQSKGYSRYIKEANSVGLADKWKKKVQNGTIDLSTVKDEKLIEKIKNYQKWYEKALDCKDAIEKLKEKEAELYRQRFDNISSDYDGMLQLFDFRKSMLEEGISQSEEKGYLVSTSYYSALIQQEKNNINKLKAKRTALRTALKEGMAKGKIEKGSKDWYDMTKEIDDTTLSIEKATTALAKYNAESREVQWQIFDLLQDRISKVTDESEFLIDLLSSKKLYDDKGQLTKEGMSTMGLHGVNYNVEMGKAAKYRSEIAKLDKQLKKDPYNNKLIERREELIELQQESINSAREEKEAIRDMVEKGIELELDALDELIDKYTDALDSQKDLYDYQKKVGKQTEEIASLQKQLAAYENDTSEESRAKVQQHFKSTTWQLRPYYYKTRMQSATLLSVAVYL